MTDLKDDIAWAAGIVEGEGTFVFFKRKNRPNTYCRRIGVEMTDRDVVLRLKNAFGVGNVVGPRIRPPRKPSWIWQVQKDQDIFDVLIKLAPYLGERRSIQAGQLFDFLEGKLVT